MNNTSVSILDSTVLAVDDDAVSLRLLECSLRHGGFTVVAVDSAEAAREFIAEHGSAAVQCVVTDYQMPFECGLELLLWIRQHDPALSVIMITATTERELVTATLRGGAVDFLDKPVREAAVCRSVSHGVNLTRLRRQSQETERAVARLGRAQHQLFGLSTQAAAQIELCFHPRHQAGGDFVSYFQMDPDTFLVLTADVSGHDLHAAFVSAYFQGMMRGMLDAGQSITSVFAKFNRFLIEDWDKRHVGSVLTAAASISVCASLVNLRSGEATLSNHGFPVPWRITSHGRIEPCSSGSGHPLGWFDELSQSPYKLCGGGQLCLWTDGLEDLAEELGVNPLALATGLHHAQQRNQVPAMLARARDDILVVTVRLDSDAANWMPVWYEQSAGDANATIDRSQTSWDLNLQMAVPDLSESRRYDVLLALREAVLNARQHGCGGRADQNCCVTLTVDPAKRLLRAVVVDPGPGHDFVVADVPAETEPDDLHRGLRLIERLATRVTRLRRGAELVLDFRY